MKFSPALKGFMNTCSCFLEEIVENKCQINVFDCHLEIKFTCRFLFKVMKFMNLLSLGQVPSAYKLFTTTPVTSFSSASHTVMFVRHFGK